MTGGAGDDRYYVDDVGDGVVEGTGGGTDFVDTTLSAYSLGANVERLRFVGTGAFTGTGNELANGLTGGAGDDTLNGGDGNDALRGGGGADTMTGGDGADSLDGAAGADTLIGGWSADKLTGGADADVFVFRDARDSTRTSRDTIYDFTVGTDSIDFTQMLTGGSFHALQTVTSAPATIDADSLVAVVSGGNTVLYVNDTDASQTIRNASMEIFLRGVTTLGDADLDYLLI